MKNIVCATMAAARWVVPTLSLFVFAGIVGCTAIVGGDDESDTAEEQNRRTFAAGKSKCNGGIGLNWSYCSNSCPCAINEGDCDKDSHCQEGLKCRRNIGDLFFVNKKVDVCMPADWEPAQCGTLSACGDTCVDLATDPINCGACDNACEDDAACVEGACVDAEPSDAPCNSNTDCPEGEVCQVGFCTFSECPDGNCGTPPVCGDGACDVGESCSSCEADCGPCSSGGGGCGCGGGSSLPCVPSTCADLGNNCGDADDGCGGTINCGTCGTGEQCDGGTCKPGGGGSILVSCTALTCADLGTNCGDADDGCGGTINCGTCGTGEQCDGGTCKPRSGSISVNDNICAGSCNKKVIVGSNSCYCDDVCTKFKDCCQDANGSRGADHAYVDVGCP